MPSQNPFTLDALDRRMRSMSLIWLSIFATLVPPAIILSPAIFAGKVSILAVFGLWVIPVGGWVLRKLAYGRGLKPHAAARVHAALAFMLGACFSRVIVAAWTTLDPTLAAAVMGGSALVLMVALSRLHCTMLAFCIGLLFRGAPGEAGVLTWVALAALFVCLCFIAIGLARADATSDSDRWKADQNALRSNRFLDEVEQNSAGWFWETDRQGEILYLSPKVAAWLGSDPDTIKGKLFTSIGTEESRSSALGERTLGFYLSTRTAFSDLAVATSITDKEQWWSVSGRPVTDKYGQFRGFIGTGTDLTEQRRSEAEVTKLARFDPLTGLANRAETSTMLNRALAGQPGSVRPTALMLIDLDRFKAVNDTLGHPAGDELLKQVSKRLTQVVGSSGQVGRLGGDEFKVVLPGVADSHQLVQLADAIIREVSRPYQLADATANIGASLGIARSPQDGTTSEELVRNADLALYAAKAAGRGVHRFYERGMHSVAEERRRLDDDMRSALLRGEFRLVYQPIVSLKDERIVGFESLLRWQHPTRGPVSPADFIPIAEENGLIEAIGEWTLRQACEEAAGWAVDARVAINISATQFSQPRFPELVANTLAQTGLAPDRLEIEITEGVFVTDDASTDRQFDLLKKLGVRIALDDFGTGYSSLGYLKRAPFDKIKIDQSFVRGASLGGDKSGEIIKAIVALAVALNMETTAEGVETQDEIDFIRDLGCSHIQGFVFGKPLEVDDLRARLGTRGNEADRVGHKATRETRLRVIRAAQLTINGRPHPARLRNISNGGVMIEGPAWVSVGTPVQIDIVDDMTVDGVVQWADEGRLGIAFANPLDLNKVMAQAKKSSDIKRAQA